MDYPQEWTDSYYTSKYRTVYTRQELGIPGLRMFGKHTMNQACAPLLPHFHRNAYEFTFVTEGTLTFTVGERDYELSGYDVFMTRPNEVHSTNLIPLSTGEILWFQLDVSEDHLFFLNEEAGEHLVSGLAQLPPHTFHAGSSMLTHIKKAFDLAASPRLRYQASSFLLLALYEIMALSQDGCRSVSPDMERILQYIKENITQELPLEDLAHLCGLSLSQFKQKFKSQTGISPRHYINYRKIQMSKQMLMEQKSVTDIAMELGFGSSSYFTVVFRRFNACTPSEYRKKAEEKQL